MIRAITLFTALLMATVAHGQQGAPPNGSQGRLSGTLNGVTGKRNVVIVLTEVNTGASQRITPSDDGRFNVAIAPGTYRVELQADNFKQPGRENLVVPAGGTTQLRLAIEGPPNEENIEIDADASLVQDEPSEFGRTYTTLTVHTLPVPDRNYQELAGLMPGITPPVVQFTGTFDPQMSRQFTANGLPPYVNDQMSDGISVREPFTGVLPIRVLPNEAIQELQVRTTTFPASSGFASGAITNVFMRPGTNGLHGSVFGFFSDDFLQARNPFNPSGNPAPTFHQWQFGATAGGALIPDRLFWFGSYQGSIDNGRALELATVPTAAMRTGSFAALGFPIYNPATGTAAGTGRVPFTGSLIARPTFSPVAAAYLSFLPAANQPGLANNLASDIPYGMHAHVPDVRVDYRISNTFSGFLRYGWSDINSREASIFGPVLGGTDYSALRNHHASISVEGNYHGILAEFRIGYNRYRNLLTSQEVTSPLASALPLAFRTSGGVPSITIDGLGTLGTPAGFPARDIDNVFEGGANFYANFKGNQFVFGVDVRDLSSNGFINPAFSNLGSFYFGPGPVSLSGAAIAPGSALASSFASFLLGAPTTAGVFSYASNPAYHQRQYAAHVGDTLKLFNRITLDLGLRYELYSPVQMGSATGSTVYNPVTNAVSFGDTTGDYHYRNFAPRVGVAFSATDKTVVRTGYAIHYFPLPFSQLGINPTGFGTSRGVVGSFASTSFTIPPVISGSSAATLPYTINSLNRTPYVQSYYFLIQQTLPLGFLMDVGYVGNTGKALPYFLPTNVAAPGTGLLGLPLRLLGQTAPITAERIGASSKYNSLQVNLTKRLSAGLSFAVAYTYSKALDYGWSNLANPFSIRSNYGLSDYDRTHILTASHVLAVPVGTGSHHLNQGWAGRMLASWQFNGVFRWASGTPYSALADSISCNCPGTATVFANSLNSTALNGEANIGSGSFATPAPNSFGTSGRNAFRGPDLTSYDVALFKTFPFMENKKLELRGEAYNIFNSTQFGNPYSNISLGTFGAASPVRGSVFDSISNGGRTFVLGARILF